MQTSKNIRVRAAHSDIYPQPQLPKDIFRADISLAKIFRKTPEEFGSFPIGTFARRKLRVQSCSGSEPPPSDKPPSEFSHPPSAALPRAKFALTSIPGGPAKGSGPDSAPERGLRELSLVDTRP